MNESASTGPAPRRLAVWLILLAAGGTFALTMGTRQALGLFLGSLNTATGLGLGVGGMVAVGRTSILRRAGELVDLI